MNIVQHEKLEFFFSAREVSAALKAAFPNEFLVRRLPLDGRLTHMSASRSGLLLLTHEPRSTSASEFDTNRATPCELRV